MSDEYKNKYNSLEIARILGEPKDPFKPYPELITRICDTDYADPDEYVYYFDVLAETDTIYTTVASGVTQSNVSPDTPAAMTFVDIASPEYYVKITDLASAKEKTLARKLKTIQRSLNAYENYYVLNLVNTACVSQGNTIDLTSGTYAFTYENLISMLDLVKDYGDRAVLVAGTQIDKDIILWNWTDNKYQSLKAAFEDLNIDVIRINQTVTIDSVSTSVLSTSRAFLVATDTEVGKPILFVRKRLNDIDLLGGVIKKSGEKPERLVFVSPNPITVTGTARYLAVGMTGYEQIVAAVTNAYGIVRFDRS